MYLQNLYYVYNTYLQNCSVPNTYLQNQGPEQSTYLQNSYFMIIYVPKPVHNGVPWRKPAVTKYVFF